MSGSFEVRFADGRESLFFYWDNIPARRLRRDMMDRETALETAKAVARAARENQVQGLLAMTGCDCTRMEA